MNHDHPCPAPDFEFWFSRSEEGPFHPGGNTIEDAVTEALCQGDFQEIDPDDDHPEWRAGVFIIIARPRHVDLSKWFDAERWVEDLMERTEDECDESGDCHPLEGMDLADQKALQAAVRNAIWHWQNRRALPLNAYWLETQGTARFETRPHPENKSDHS